MGPRGRGRGYATGPLDKGTLLRVFKYVFRDYSFALLFVAVLIGINAYTHLQGTLFMQKLIDIYILPMLGSSDTNFDRHRGGLSAQHHYGRRRSGLARKNAQRAVPQNADPAHSLL